MSEGVIAIIGASIGGAVVLVATIITSGIALLTWTRNIKFEILKDERDRLDQQFELALESFHEGLKSGELPAMLVAKFQHEFPANVRKEFNETISQNILSGSNDEAKQQAYVRLSFEMAKAISKRNAEIRKTAEVVDSQFALNVAMEIIKSGLLKW